MHITGEPDGSPVKVRYSSTAVYRWELIVVGRRSDYRPDDRSLVCCFTVVSQMFDLSERTASTAVSGRHICCHGADAIVIAIMAALLGRARTGKGSWIDASLFESQISTLANIGSNWLIAGQEATRHGTAHPSCVVKIRLKPTKNAYTTQHRALSDIPDPRCAFCSIGATSVRERTQTDSWIMIGAGNDRQFSILSRLLGEPSWSTDPRFSSNSSRVANRSLLIPLMRDVLTSKPLSHWLEALKGQGIPFAPINGIEKTFGHPQAIERGVTVEVDHPRAGLIKLLAPAVVYDGEKMKVERPPPGGFAL